MLSWDVLCVSGCVMDYCVGFGRCFGFCFVPWGLVLSWEVFWFWIVFGISAWDLGGALCLGLLYWFLGGALCFVVLGG